MIESIVTVLKLLAGSVIHRPYVYAFFLCYFVFSWRQLRPRDWLIYTTLSYGVAFLAEYSSTRNGFPFGHYVYLDHTRHRELWISNVPFWDSLSFVFLSYFSWMAAASTLDPQCPTKQLPKPRCAILAGILMTALDVVIDPVTLLGDRWFLGKIYYYPQGGTYFGVTLSNFAGWFFVGSVTILLFQFLGRIRICHPSAWRPLSRMQIRGALAVYSGVFLFNLGITAWVGERRLLTASIVVVLLTLLPCWFRNLSICPIRRAQ